MQNHAGKTSAVGLALALLGSMAARAAGEQPAGQSLVPKAMAFVRTLANGDFKNAEADFTDQMKQAAPPEKLREIWQRLIEQDGPFHDTGDGKILVQNGYTTVVVKADFDTRALGIAVTFDSARRIAGMHILPPP